MYGFLPEKWSGAAQAIAGDGKPGDSAIYLLDDLKSGDYELILYATKAADYGIITFLVNGRPTNVNFDGYYDKVIRGKVSLGKFSPVQGKIKLEIRIEGANQKMVGKRYMYGLDCIQLIKN